MECQTDANHTCHSLPDSAACRIKVTVLIIDCITVWLQHQPQVPLLEENKSAAKAAVPLTHTKQVHPDITHHPVMGW